jgi:hypothetical protein
MHLMGVPTSEVGYTSVKPGEETTKSIRDVWWRRLYVKMFNTNLLHGTQIKCCATSWYWTSEKPKWIQKFSRISRKYFPPPHDAWQPKEDNMPVCVCVCVCALQHSKSHKFTLFYITADNIIRFIFDDDNYEILYFEHSFVHLWCWNVDTSENRL